MSYIHLSSHFPAFPTPPRTLITRWHRYLADRFFYPVTLASMLACSFLVGRYLFSGVFAGFFLVWNLFLAWVPYLMALWAEHSALHRPGRRWLAWAPALLWLLFLPNAHYILTDLVHFRYMDFTWWYDLGLLLSFALAGSFLGLASLQVMQRLVRRLAGWLVSWLFVMGSALLSGFGIYLGRFLRWNSWDVFHQPFNVLSDLVAPLLDPLAHPRTYGVTLMFAALILVSYLAFPRSQDKS